MVAERSPTAAPQQAGNGLGQQAGADRLERAPPREDIRRTQSESDRHLKLYPSSRQRKCMERIDERIQSLVALVVARQPGS